MAGAPVTDDTCGACGASLPDSPPAPPAADPPQILYRFWPDLPDQWGQP